MLNTLTNVRVTFWNPSMCAANISLTFFRYRLWLHFATVYQNLSLNLWKKIKVCQNTSVISIFFSSFYMTKHCINDTYYCHLLVRSLASSHTSDKVFPIPFLVLYFFVYLLILCKSLIRSHNILFSLCDYKATIITFVSIFELEVCNITMGESSLSNESSNLTYTHISL